MVEQRLFDIPSAAAYLRELGASCATVSFVRTIIANGQIPYLRVGKKFFVSREAIDHWIQSRERRTRP